jgi:hypothetical protein
MKIVLKFIASLLSYLSRRTSSITGRRIAG